MSYRVEKSFLSARDILAIKNDLFVEGNPNQYGPTETLRAFGETVNSLYMPFAYAKKRYQCTPNKEHPFPKAAYTFYSDKYSFRTTPSVNQKEVFDQAKKIIRKNRTVLLSIHCGGGKCLGKDTQILMYDGTIKLVQDIQVGDQVMGDDSTPRIVTSLARGREEMYEIIPTKGDSYTVNKSHILSLKISGNKHIMKFNRKGEQIGWIAKWFDHSQLKLRTKNFYFHQYLQDETVAYEAAVDFLETVNSPDTIDINVEDYIKLPPTFHGPAGPLLGYRVGVEFPAQPVDLNPYMLGYWLGDGSQHTSKITTVDQPILDYFTDKLQDLDLYLSQVKHDPITYTIRGYTGYVGSNGFLNALKKYKLIKNKHIPIEYKRNSREVRLQLLAGILDADGSETHKGFDIIQKSKIFAQDIVFLCRSLGLAAYIRKCQKTCTNARGGPKIGTYYRISISGHTDMIPTKLERKQAGKRIINKDPLVTRIKVVPKGIGDYYGFTIDGNHRFLLGDFTVTHNTYLGLRIAHGIGLKSGILVHRGVLVDQWIDSIQKFTNARVQVVDTDGVLDPTADFYIFNIAFVHKRWHKERQTWVPKKLGIYKDIGTLIVDEAHIACAADMSRALLYFTPRIAIALTATPTRKDGMDKALELYFGDYKTTQIVRIATDPFTVYRLPTGIKPDFSYNAHGKKDWNSVITSLVENEQRNQIIIDLIVKFKTFNILVLTKRKDHCKLLSTMLGDLGISNTVMVGTAKKYDKTARVLLSTYSKLGVGFDDSRLNMLIVACSVTEVEQYAGRLRDAPDKKRIIIDLVDDDPNCKKHWGERRKWYVSRKGEIKHYYREFKDDTPPRTPSPEADLLPALTTPPKESTKRLARKIDGRAGL